MNLTTYFLTGDTIKVTFITVILRLTIAHGGEIVFYGDVDFKGPILYNITFADEITYHLCIDLSEGVQTQAPSSLKTSNFLELIDYPDCNERANLLHHSKAAYALKLRPGQYRNLPEIFRDARFPCSVLSLNIYDNQDELSWEKRMEHKIYFSEGLLSELFLVVEHLCSSACLDLPESAYNRIGRVTGDFYCLNLYSEPKCGAKFVRVLGGTAASEDLRLLSFKGVAMSLKLCENAVMCDGKATKMHLWNDAIKDYLILPSSPLQEVSRVEGYNSAFFKIIQPPLDVTRCENSTNFTCATSCGGIIYTRDGTIRYKMREALVSFERCVWIIKPSAPNSRFNVTQIWSGFKPTRGKQEVVISAYENLEDWNQKRFFPIKTRRINETTWRHPEFDAPFMIVTLYTENLEADSGESRGFMLEYSSSPIQEYTESQLKFLSSSFDSMMTYGQNQCIREERNEIQSDGKMDVSTYTFVFLPSSKDDVASGLKTFVVDFGLVFPEVDMCKCTWVNCSIVIIHRFKGHEWYPGIASHWRESIPHYDMIMLVLLKFSGSAFPDEGFCMNSSAQEYKMCLNEFDALTDHSSWEEVYENLNDNCTSKWIK